MNIQSKIGNQNLPLRILRWKERKNASRMWNEERETEREREFKAFIFQNLVVLCFLSFGLKWHPLSLNSVLLLSVWVGFQWLLTVTCVLLLNEAAWQSGGSLIQGTERSSSKALSLSQAFVAPEVPWLVAASLPSLPPSSQGIFSMLWTELYPIHMLKP